MSPISESMSNALFFLVILLLVPAILGALQMEGLLSPLREMTTKALDMLPNAVATLIVGGVDMVQLSRLAGLPVFILVFVPPLIAALDALKIEAISGPATDMLAMLMESVPRIVPAGLILAITWMVASFSSRLLTSLLVWRKAGIWL